MYEYASYHIFFQRKLVMSKLESHADYTINNVRKKCALVTDLLKSILT